MNCVLPLLLDLKKEYNRHFSPTSKWIISKNPLPLLLSFPNFGVDYPAGDKKTYQRQNAIF
jgi:hypothetical protein